MSLKKQIEELERRVKELEQRPITIQPVYIPVTYPVPAPPCNPYYVPPPYPLFPPTWPTITC